eukprot:3946978-Alexandrium_andersonii.AAC.2
MRKRQQGRGQEQGVGQAPEEQKGVFIEVRSTRCRCTERGKRVSLHDCSARLRCPRGSAMLQSARGLH